MKRFLQQIGILTITVCCDWSSSVYAQQLPLEPHITPAETSPNKLSAPIADGDRHEDKIHISQHDNAAISPVPVVTLSAPTYPHRNSPRKHMWLFGGGGSYGIIYPKEINSYMQDWINTRDNYAVTSNGLSDMVMTYTPNLSLLYAPIEYINFELFTEFSWAPKFLPVKNGESRLFHFIRFSPGVTIVCNIPINSYKNSIFLGAGVEFDVMRFEEFVGSSFGIRAKAGLRFYMPNRSVDVFSAVLVTKDKSNEIANTRIELNYTTMLFGTTVYFNIS